MIDRLNTQFGIDDALVFSSGQGDMPRAEINTPQCRGEVYLHGAHVTRFRPAEHDEVLWLSERTRFQDATPIRGGIPICFPWFGGNAPANLPDAPAHGLARIQSWQVAATAKTDTGVSITLQTTVDAFDLTYRVHFGEELGLELSVTNTADHPQTFEEALHTYFTVSQIKRVHVTGLAGASYFDTVGGSRTARTQDQPEITFTAETDRIYQSSAETVLHDPGLERLIRVKKTNSETAVVWNPWIDKSKAMGDFGDDEWPGMVCIESANVEPNAVTLQPGESHVMGTTVQVQRIG